MSASQPVLAIRVPANGIPAILCGERAILSREPWLRVLHAEVTTGNRTPYQP